MGLDNMYLSDHCLWSFKLRCPEQQRQLLTHPDAPRSLSDVVSAYCPATCLWLLKSNSFNHYGCISADSKETCCAWGRMFISFLLSQSQQIAIFFFNHSVLLFSCRSSPSFHIFSIVLACDGWCSVWLSVTCQLGPPTSENAQPNYLDLVYKTISKIWHVIRDLKSYALNPEAVVCVNHRGNFIMVTNHVITTVPLITLYTIIKY